MVEGTPLLREHLVKNWIQGSNPCVSASTTAYIGLGPFRQPRYTPVFAGFFVFTC